MSSTVWVLARASRHSNVYLELLINSSGRKNDATLMMLWNQMATEASCVVM